MGSFFFVFVLWLMASKGICSTAAVDDDCLEWEWVDVSGAPYSEEPVVNGYEYVAAERNKLSPALDNLDAIVEPSTVYTPNIAPIQPIDDGYSSSSTQLPESIYSTVPSNSPATEESDVDGYEFLARLPSAAQESNVPVALNRIKYLDSTVEPSTVYAPHIPDEPIQPVDNGYISTSTQLPERIYLTVPSNSHTAEESDVDGYQYVAAEQNKLPSVLDDMIYLDSTVEPSTVYTPHIPDEHIQQVDGGYSSTSTQLPQSIYPTVPSNSLTMEESLADGYEFLARLPSAAQAQKSNVPVALNGINYLDSTVEPSTASLPLRDEHVHCQMNVLQNERVKQDKRPFAQEPIMDGYDYVAAKQNSLPSALDGMIYLDSTVEPSTVYTPRIPDQHIQPVDGGYSSTSTQSQLPESIYPTVTSNSPAMEESLADGYEFLARLPSAAQDSNVPVALNGIKYLDSTVEPSTVYAPHIPDEPIQPVDNGYISTSTQLPESIYSTVPSNSPTTEESVVDGYGNVADERNSLSPAVDGMTYLDSTVEPSTVYTPYIPDEPIQPVDDGYSSSSTQLPESIYSTVPSNLPATEESDVDGYEFLARLPSTAQESNVPVALNRIKYLDSTVEPSTASLPLQDSYVVVSTAKPVTVPILTHDFDGKYVSKVKSEDSGFAVDKLKGTEPVHDSFANTRIRPHYGAAEKMYPPESPVADVFLGTNHRPKQNQYRKKIPRGPAAYNSRKGNVDHKPKYVPPHSKKVEKVQLKADLFDGPILSKHLVKDSQFSLNNMKPTSQVSDSFGASELRKTQIHKAEKPYPPKAIVYDNFMGPDTHYLRKRDLSKITTNQFPTGKMLKCKRRRSELSASAAAADGQAAHDVAPPIISPGVDFSATTTPVAIMQPTPNATAEPLPTSTTAAVISPPVASTTALPSVESVDKAVFCRSRSDGFYRFPGNCSRILQCFDSEVLEYPPCPFNLAFDPEREICDYADNVRGCGSSLRVNRFDASPFSTGECADHDHGDHVANQQDCASFYRCVWGRAVLMKCPGGTYFNPTISVCDYPSQVPTCHS